MAKAKKLPSGSWRVQVYDYTDAQGKRHYKSFTVDDPSAAGRREAERLAATWAVQKKMESNPSTMTLKAAFSSYIESREAILSPATIREYKRSAKTDLQELMPIKICDLTQETIQQAINHEALTHSPKSVRNMHGLLSAVLQAYRKKNVRHCTSHQTMRSEESLIALPVLSWNYRSSSLPLAQCGAAKYAHWIAEIYPGTSYTSAGTWFGTPPENG